MPIEPSDIFLAVVRIVAAIAVIVVFFGIFTALEVTVKTADVERTALELGEAFISSDLATDRGIIDETRLPGPVAEIDAPLLDLSTRRRLLADPRPEPVRHCLFGARYVIRDGQNRQVSAMGMLVEPADAETKFVNFPIWLAKGTALRPGSLEVQTYLSPTTRVLCAAETAWVEGLAEVEADCPFPPPPAAGPGGFPPPPICDIRSEPGKVCISGFAREECRVMGIDVRGSWVGSARLRFTRVGNIVQAEVV